MAEARAHAWTLPVAGLDPLSLNDRGHWSRKDGLRKKWRRDIALLAREARIPNLDRIHVQLHAWPPTNARRDADNLVKTLKVCIDGLRDAKVIVDDTPEYVDWSPPQIHPTRCAGMPTDKKHWSWEIVITEIAVPQVLPLWWHVFRGTCEHMDADVTHVYGESTMAPDELQARADLHTEPARCGKGCTVSYVESHDHDPDADAVTA